MRAFSFWAAIVAVSWISGFALPACADDPVPKPLPYRDADINFDNQDAFKGFKRAVQAELLKELTARLAQLEAEAALPDISLREANEKRRAASGIRKELTSVRRITGMNEVKYHIEITGHRFFRSPLNARVGEAAFFNFDQRSAKEQKTDQEFDLAGLQGDEVADAGCVVTEIAKDRPNTFLATVTCRVAGGPDPNELDGMAVDRTSALRELMTDQDFLRRFGTTGRSSWGTQRDALRLQSNIPSNAGIDIKTGELIYDTKEVKVTCLFDGFETDSLKVGQYLQIVGMFTVVSDDVKTTQGNKLFRVITPYYPPDVAPAEDAAPAAEVIDKDEKAAAGKLTAAKKLIDTGKREAGQRWLNEIVKRYPGTAAAEEAEKLLGTVK